MMLPATSPLIEIVEAQEQDQLKQVRLLFGEYFSELPQHLYFAHFDQELASLPGEYAPPSGSLLLATVNGEAAACVGLRPYRGLAGACEMKRLYVRPAFRGLKLGRLLVQRVIDAARARGYRRLRLDTHPPTMQAAVTLYERLNFVTVTDVPDAIPSLVYMELDLLA